MKNKSIKYRLYNKKYKLYSDDIMWPNNQYTHEKYFLDSDGKVKVLIAFERFGWTLEECDQREWKVKLDGII